MDSIIKALRIIATKDIRSPHEFAKEMWPNSEGWQRYGKVGYGVHKGAVMNLAAGGFLGKLRAKGLIWGGCNRDRIILTDKGRRWLKGETVEQILDQFRKDPLSALRTGD